MRSFSVTSVVKNHNRLQTCSIYLTLPITTWPSCLALDSLLTSLALLAVMMILPFPLDNLSRKASEMLALVLPSDPRDIK